jgi:Mycothiol maleylpyruvate isomerase N-terminal domain
VPKKERTLFPTRTPLWRVRDLVKHLGGVAGVAEKLMAKGYHPPPADTMQGWLTRNQIPSPWVPAVLGLAMDEQLIAHPEELLLKETM